MNKKEVTDVIVTGEKARKGEIVGEITVAAVRIFVVPTFREYGWTTIWSAAT